MADRISAADRSGRLSGKAIQASPPSGLTPWQFELACADALNAAGWQARVTSASGDQGIDVLAKRQGVTVVIQCKLYSKPVGNKAVQEAIAGKTYAGADHAAVVSNASYTASAVRLAQVAKVHLLGPGDLERLHRILKLPELVALPEMPSPAPPRAPMEFSKSALLKAATALLGLFALGQCVSRKPTSPHSQEDRQRSQVQPRSP